MPTDSTNDEKSRPRWLLPALAATGLLIVTAVGAYLLYGRELFQQLLLAIAVVVAWLGAQVGISIGSDPGRPWASREIVEEM